MGDLLSVLPNKAGFRQTGLLCLLPSCGAEWASLRAIVMYAALSHLTSQMSRCSLPLFASISLLPILRFSSGVFESSPARAYLPGGGRMSQIALRIQPFDNTAPNRE